ncbi:hypothetical protein SPONN_490 [uncultured Candidatus Thioglobus sp.]|nr:hypothetical protein SPONN_490 [uncultured Candidatus Thioglobus sp.]
MMLNFLIILLLKFGCISASQPNHCNADATTSICVTNNPSNSRCQSTSNCSLNINQLSHFLLFYTEIYISIFLTNEVHLLERVLTFKAGIANITITGSENSGELATIKCTNDSGIEFAAENGHIEISNAILLSCGRSRSIPTLQGKYLVALYFNSNTYSLYHVTVQNCGIGVFAFRSKNQVISNCNFLDNDNGHIKIIGTYSVTIYKTLLYNGSSSKGAGIQIAAKPSLIRKQHDVRNTYSTKMNITESIFMQNKANNGSNFYLLNADSTMPVSSDTHLIIYIRDCLFTQTVSAEVESFGIVIYSASSLGASIKMNVTVTGSNFTDNENGGMVIRNARSVIIDQCEVINNKGTGIQVSKQKNGFYEISTPQLFLAISHSIFLYNARALVLHIILDSFADIAETLVTDCIFAHNSDLIQSGNLLVPSAVYILGNTGSYFLYPFGGINYGYYQNNMIRIEDSKFENNSYDFGRSCSSLYLSNVDNITVSNIVFTECQCSAIILNGSFIRIHDKVNISQNHGILGGGLLLRHTFLLNKRESTPPIPKFSRITFCSNGYLYLNENTALEYGGAIYTDEACDYRHNEYCFFRFESTDNNLLTRLNFVNNHAKLGGDAIFGGCLSNCSIEPNKSVDTRRKGSIFWDIVSFSGGEESQSLFAEHPYRVVLCKNSTFHPNGVVCSSETHNVSVYRGETFPIRIMAVGSSCFPSSDVILAAVSKEHNKNGIRIGREQGIKQLNPYCDEYLFSLFSDGEEFDVFSIIMKLTLEGRGSHSTVPALIGVEYKNYCPPGFELDPYREKCVCSFLLASNGIICNPDYSLTVPSLTWIGLWHDFGAVGPYCQHCRVFNEEVIIDAINSSDKLCAFGRKGLICGNCIRGFSIKLGGYECGDCSKSNYKGVLLTISFAIIGFILTFLLLRLNVTISTGLINGLIFYSNIIYSNHMVFLPISRDSYKTRLDNMARFLYIFQAWLNLDFGFDICLFNGIDTYTATWLQFVFPIYIWLLIFITVVISRYSTRVSKFTGHNTISVLATLLLLSYTKLLLAILSTSSYTQLYLANGKKSTPLWSSDANIRYLTGKHNGLFLMGVLMTLIYVLPFTVIVTLGPILQTYSHRKGLRWIVRIKPFLDAFYGPYTVRYRYWPGIFLLLRLFLLSIFAFYSLGDERFIATVVAISTSSVFLLWLLWGKKNLTSLHRNGKLNLLESFFLFNLMLFATISAYLGKELYKRQILAVVMVGSIFLVFCGILAYHISSAVKTWRITGKIVCAVGRLRKGNSEDQERENENSELPNNEGNACEKGRNDNIVTQTTIAIDLEKKEFKKLREPLLDTN